MTTTTRQPDGTVSTYNITNPATWAALQSVKPMRRPALARRCKREFPQWRADMSTADYVNQYFGLNSHIKIAAYPRYETNWLSLYAPLPDTPAAWAPDTVEIETVED
jgi:hypothetical protein